MKSSPTQRYHFEIMLENSGTWRVDLPDGTFIRRNTVHMAFQYAEQFAQEKLGAHWVINWSESDGGYTGKLYLPKHMRVSKTI